MTQVFVYATLPSATEDNIHVGILSWPERQLIDYGCFFAASSDLRTASQKDFDHFRVCSKEYVS
jgi:hypothetical protein